jgi:hypothetical protein
VDAGIAIQGAGDDKGFDASQRWQILDAELPVPGALRIDPKALLELAQFNVGLDARETDLFVGVGRKGKSFLDEVRRDLQMDESKICSNSELAGRDVSRHRVLIVDDAIHTGDTMTGLVKTLRAAGASAVRGSVILASEKGMTAIQGSGLVVDIRSVLLVPEDYYTGTYQRSLVPAMEHYRGGSLSNRPCKVIEGRAASYDPAQAAQDALRSVATWTMADGLGQTPFVDGDVSPIFRGTLEIGPRMDAKLQEWSGGLEHEQAKVRIFIDTRDHLAIHASAVYYPMVPAPATEQQLKDAESSVCIPLLASLAEHVRGELLRYGYSVNLP